MSMEVLSPGGVPNGAPAVPLTETPDPSVVLEHLAEVIQITLGALRKELEAVGSLLSKSKYSESLQRCARFSSESQVALYAQKDIAEHQTNGTSNDERELYVNTQSLS